MRVWPSVPIALAAACAALATGGCGGAATEPAPDPGERADPPAKLLPGWTRAANPAAGFTLGLPPGWTARRRGAATLVGSADGALACSVASDRSPSGQAQPLPAYARATIAGLRGYANLRPGSPAAVRGQRYLTQRQPATGVYRRTKVRQAITLYAIRRPRRVTYTLLCFRSAAVPATVYASAIGEMVATFRAGPPAL